MGLIGKMIVKTVAKKAGETVLIKTDKHLNKTRSVNALVKKSDAKDKIIIKRKSFSFKRGFSVEDVSKNKRYTIKKDKISFGYPCMRLYDLNDNEIGRIETIQKRARGTNLEVYSMYRKGVKVGEINRKLTFKMKLELDFNGWKLEGDFWHNNFSVYDKSGNIMIQIKNAYSSQDTYVMEINDKANEIIGLLLLMAVEIAVHGND